MSSAGIPLAPDSQYQAVSTQARPVPGSQYPDQSVLRLVSQFPGQVRLDPVLLVPARLDPVLLGW